MYILLPVHNRREITRRFVECLKTQTYQQYHLVLIDDGSTDGTEEMVREEIGSCTVIKGSGDWWWAGSLQQGYLWLKQHDVEANDIVLIINDDTEFDRNFLETGARLLEQHDKTLFMARCYNRRNNELSGTGIHVDWGKLTFNDASTPEEINCLSTRGLFLKTAAFFEIGGFHPRLLPHYLSDYEFTIRAFKKGMKLCTDSKLKLWLDEETTGHRQISYRTFGEFLSSYYSMRSIFNPLQWTAFIALACPWPWNLIHGTKVWIRAIGSTSKALVISGMKLFKR
jgi:GT2 family glycosyltransferase